MDPESCAARAVQLAAEDASMRTKRDVPVNLEHRIAEEISQAVVEERAVCQLQPN